MSKPERFRMPRSVLYTACGLALVAAGAGWLAGNSRANLSETDAIEAVAARWLALGGRAADCAAVPGQGVVWLIVRCTNGDAAAEWRVDRSGRLLEKAMST